MAYNTAPGRAEYTATAGQTVFPFVFKIYVETDIKVYLTPVGQTPDDTADLLTLGTDYTVAIAGDSGGSITLLTGATLNDAVTLKRDLPVDRTTEYQTSGDLLATTLNADQDYQTYLIGDKEADNERALRVAESVQGVDTVLPNPVALKAVRWDSTGKKLENVSLSDGNFVNTFNSVADRSELLLLTGAQEGETILQRDIGLLYAWTDTQGTDDGGTVLNVGTGSWLAQYSGAVNVKWFGAKFDGVTDDTLAIQAANDASGFDTIEYPFAVAIVTDTITVKKNIIGNGCIFKFNNLTIKKATLNISNLTQLHFENFKIDGQATVISGTANQDPTSWATEYDSFLGGTGIYAIGLSRCSFKDIYVYNSAQAGMSLNQSSDINIENFNTLRTRGEFGDGLYIGQCNRVKINRCYINDFTRIGFVFEAGSIDVSAANCSAFNGSNAGVNYGGTEYNSGFWAERSSDVQYNGCTAKSTVEGFVVVTATDVLLDDTHTYNITDCHSKENLRGFTANAFQKRMITTIKGCTSISALDNTIAFLNIIQAGDENIISYEACYGEVNDNPFGGHLGIFNILNKNASSLHDTINITDTTGKILNPNSCDSSSYNNGDIVFLDGSEIGLTPTVIFGNTDLVVNNYNADNVNFFTYMRNKYATNNSIRASFTNTKRIKIVATFPSVSFFADTLEFNNCSFSDVIEISDCNEMIFNSSTINNLCVFTYRGLEVRGDLFINGGRIQHFPPVADTKKPLFNLYVIGERDIDTNDYMIRTNYVDANKPLFILKGSLYNSGAATATKTFVYSQGGELNNCIGLVVDANVTFSLKSIAALTNLTNESISTMH